MSEAEAVPVVKSAPRAKKREREKIAQWYVVLAFTGREEAVAENLRNKIKALDMANIVQEITVVTETVKKEVEVKREDAPERIRNTKNTTWSVQPNGSYKKITTTKKSKSPGYIYVKMVLDEAAWFQIRNTDGVTGMVGSSGHKTMPIPITTEEILTVLGLPVGATVEIKEGELTGKKGTLVIDPRTNDALVQLSANRKVYVPLAHLSVAEEIVNTDKPEAAAAAEAKPVEKPKAHFVVGNEVTLKAGEMAGLSGIVASINEDKGTAIVNVDMFGRSTEVEAAFGEIEVNA